MPPSKGTGEAGLCSDWPRSVGSYQTCFSLSTQEPLICTESLGQGFLYVPGQVARFLTKYVGAITRAHGRPHWDQVQITNTPSSLNKADKTAQNTPKLLRLMVITQHWIGTFHFVTRDPSHAGTSAKKLRSIPDPIKWTLRSHCTLVTSEFWSIRLYKSQGSIREAEPQLLFWNKRTRTRKIVQIFGEIRVWIEELVDLGKAGGEACKGIWGISVLSCWSGAMKEAAGEVRARSLPHSLRTGCSPAWNSLLCRDPHDLFHHIFPVSFRCHPLGPPRERCNPIFPQVSFFVLYFSLCHWHFSTLCIWLV